MTPLVVNRSHKPGEEQFINLMDLFNQNPNRIIVVAGTVGADGTPNTAPVTLIYAKDPEDHAHRHPQEHHHGYQPAP